MRTAVVSVPQAQARRGIQAAKAPARAGSQNGHPVSTATSLTGQPAPGSRRRSRLAGQKPGDTWRQKLAAVQGSTSTLSAAWMESHTPTPAWHSVEAPRFPTQAPARQPGRPSPKAAPSKALLTAMSSAPVSVPAPAASSALAAVPAAVPVAAPATAPAAAASAAAALWTRSCTGMTCLTPKQQTWSCGQESTGIMSIIMMMDGPLSLHHPGDRHRVQHQPRCHQGSLAALCASLPSRCHPLMTVGWWLWACAGIDCACSCAGTLANVHQKCLSCLCFVPAQCATPPKHCRKLHQQSLLLVTNFSVACCRSRPI